MENLNTFFDSMEREKHAHSPTTDTAIRNSQMNISMRDAELQKTVQKETEQLTTFNTGTQEIDDELSRQLGKKWSWIAKLRNRDTHELVKSIKGDLMKESAEVKKSVYKTIMSTRLTVTRERCDTAVKMTKAEYRLKLASFLMFKQSQLREEVQHRQVNAFERLKGKYDYLETLKAYPTMYKRFEETIMKEEIENLLFLDRLVEKFESLIDEEIKNY